VQRTQHVVFVCEHGAAKSVLAASHFNTLAAQRGLDAVATARGSAPDPAIPDAVLKDLASSGTVPCVEVPTAVTDEDLRTADLVVTFDQSALAARAANATSAVAWDALPPVSVDLVKARAEIVSRVESLIDSLATAASSRH
jgi:arsenate reductase